VSAVVRYVFVRLADAHASERDALAARLREGLRGAGADATVGLPADDSAARWDLAITIRCVDLPAWHVLAATPAIATLLGAELAAVAVVVKAWTFTA